MFDELRDLYQETILERGRHPRHGARLATFDVMAEGDNPMCGDRCRVYVRHGADGTVDEIGFEARGCAISIASADLMADAAPGHTPADLRRLAERFEALVRSGDTTDPAMDALRPLSGVHEYPSRVKCATLPWRALLAALDGATEATSDDMTTGTWTPDGAVEPRPSEDDVIAACASVYDPEIPVNIYELGLIYAIELGEDARVKIEMSLTAPGCPSAQELPEQVRNAVMAVAGVAACDVEVVWDPPWDPSRMSEDARLSLNMF